MMTKIPKMPKISAEDSAEHQACANEPYYIGRKVKLSDDQWHRHAKNENYEAIK